jgi:predicted transcriptional regulator
LVPLSVFIDETDMSEKVRINLQVSPELNNILENIAESSFSTKTDVIRQALALVKIAHDAKRSGKHIGLVADSSKLDTEIVGLL